MSQKVGNIEIFMGPHPLGADDLLTPIIDFIDGAEKQLYIAIQELDSRPITEAIIRARQRKVLVKIVLEADYLRAKRAHLDPFTSDEGSNEQNRFLHNAILRANIKINTDFNSSIFHQKFIVRDGKSLLTGSTNFTDTGTSVNLNHIVIVQDEKVTRNYNREFSEIQQGHFGKRNEGHDKVPEENMVSNVRVKTLFAPDHNPEMEIMKQITKARERIDFAIFTFSESSGIDDSLVLTKQAGIKVRGALFRSAANQKWSAKDTLKDSGVELHLVPKLGLPDPSPNKLHHKLMIIDEQLIIAGSFNYTEPANKLNDENIIVIGDLDSENQDSIQKQKRLAGFVLGEIDDLIKKYGEKIS